MKEKKKRRKTVEFDILILECPGADDYQFVPLLNVLLYLLISTPIHIHDE